jgi:pimeloyl-ACP methyl ester carboxylesterase
VRTSLAVGVGYLRKEFTAAKTIADQLPNRKAVLVDGSGHDLMAEQPDAVLNALISFLM